MRYQCYVCGQVRACADPDISGCCYDTLLTISEEINTAVLRAAAVRLPELIERQNVQCDKIADEAMLSPDPRVRASAIKWRNFRHRKPT